jgi:hypothetical protein
MLGGKKYQSNKKNDQDKELGEQGPNSVIQKSIVICWLNLFLKFILIHIFFPSCIIY